MSDARGARAGDALGALVAFGRALRGRGLDVGTGRILTFCRAAVALAPIDRTTLYWAARTTLVARPEDIAAFDEVFAASFREEDDVEALDALPDAALTPTEEAVEAGAGIDLMAPGPDEGDLDEAREETSVRLVASAAEVMRTKSFEELSEPERARVAALIRALAVGMPTRHSRRVRPATRRGSFDMRRTVRASLRTEGEPFRRAWRKRALRPRPLVLVLDVSGSMSAYARALMQFGFAAMRTGHRVEVFCFGTRLTRVTRALRARDPDRALDRLTETVRDWEGGTRIGGSLKQLLDTYGQHIAMRGAVVVICSDGLERDDPDILRAQMARLGRLAHRVVWVNPLKGSAEYQPLARGMAASLPHIDLFLPGHNLASLERLAAILER